jgi:hypothetical protein
MSVVLRHAHVPQRLGFRQSSLVYQPLTLLVVLVKNIAVHGGSKKRVVESQFEIFLGDQPLGPGENYD